MIGRINWFDPDSGRGSIIGEDNVWYRIHEFTELGSGVMPKSGDVVEFRLAKSSIHPIVEVCKVVRSGI